MYSPNQIKRRLVIMKNKLLALSNENVLMIRTLWSRVHLYTYIICIQQIKSNVVWS